MKGSVTATVIMLCLVLCSGCSVRENPAGGPATPVPVRAHYVIGIDGDFSPFTGMDSGGNFSGFDIEAARWVAEKEGFTVTFVAVPWDTAVPGLNSGAVDMVWSGLTITDARKGVANLSVPYYSVNQSIAARTGSATTMQDLYEGRLRIGAQSGSTGADWVGKNLVNPGKIPPSNLTVYPDITALTGSLENGTIDASIIQTPSQNQVIQGKDLVIIGTIPVGDSYAVAVRKTDPELLEKINHGLGQLMTDPYWEHLKEKYRLD